MYICRNQTPTPWKIVLKYGFLGQNLKSMILPGKRILHVHMQKPNPHPLEIVLKYGFLDQNLKAMILPGKRILHVNMQKPNPYPLENSPQIWIFGSKSEINDFARKTQNHL